MKIEISLEEEITVKLTNLHSSNIRVWEEWNSWGWGTFYILIRDTDTNKTYKIYRDPTRDWTVNHPSYFEIRPNDSHELKFNLKDEYWKKPTEIESLRNKTIQAQAVLEIKESPESKKFNIFQGKAESDWMESIPPHNWLFEY